MAWLYQIGADRWTVFDDLGRPYSEHPTRKEGGRALSALRKLLREQNKARMARARLIIERLDPTTLPCCPLCDMAIEDGEAWEVINAHGSLCLMHSECVDSCDREGA